MWIEVPAPPLADQELAALPATLRGQLSAETDGRLGVHRSLNARGLRALRDLRGGDAAWQRAMDGIADSLGWNHPTSRYPSTMWGLLLRDLPEGEDEAWRRFLETYRLPLERTIRCVWGARAGEAPTVEEFVAWFFEKGIYRNLRRVGDDGRVHRFRGYLRRCLPRFFAQCRPAMMTELLSGHGDHALAPEDAVQQRIDEELCLEVVNQTFAELRRVNPEMWGQAVTYFGAMTLAETMERLGLGSTSTTHRGRQRALARFAAHLRRFAPDAELQALAPELARAIRRSIDDDPDARELLNATSD